MPNFKLLALLEPFKIIFSMQSVQKAMGVNFYRFEIQKIRSGNSVNARRYPELADYPRFFLSHVNVINL